MFKRPIRLHKPMFRVVNRLEFVPKNWLILNLENKEKEIRDEIIDTEYLILQNTGFEFDFDLPYTYLNNAKSVFKHK